MSSKCFLSIRSSDQNPVCTSPLPHTCYIPRRSHSSQLDYPNDIWWKIQVLIFSLCSLLHSPITSSHSGPNIFLGTLFCNFFSLCSSLNERDKASHPYKTIRKTIVLYTLIFIFLDNKLQNKKFCTEWNKAFPEFNLLLISSLIETCWADLGDQ
jgi:hypothetical protein